MELEYNNKLEDYRIIGYCKYCKSPIYENENFDVDSEGQKYHFYCYNLLRLEEELRDDEFEDKE